VQKQRVAAAGELGAAPRFVERLAAQALKVIDQRLGELSGDDLEPVAHRRFGEKVAGGDDGRRVVVPRAFDAMACPPLTVALDGVGAAARFASLYPTSCADTGIRAAR
jgi:hypothetical protein